MDKRERLFSDPESAKLFYDLLDRRIEMKLKNLKFDKTYSATVVSVGTGVADIKLQGATNTITNVKNKTGETLAVGNEVFVEAINGSLQNLVIKYKK